jgi:DNA-binding transcriptional MerR regulator
MNCTDLNNDEAKPVIIKNEEPSQTTGEFLKIGHVAKQYQVTLRTLRFYECSGLLHPKRQGMTRLYTSHDCQRLEMILRGRQLGFSLAEIHDLIETRDETLKLTDLESALGPEQLVLQIHNLERQREELEKAINALRMAYQRMHEADRLENIN